MRPSEISLLSASRSGVRPTSSSDSSRFSSMLQPGSSERPMMRFLRRLAALSVLETASTGWIVSTGSPIFSVPFVRSPLAEVNRRSAVDSTSFWQRRSRLSAALQKAGFRRFAAPLATVWPCHAVDHGVRRRLALASGGPAFRIQACSAGRQPFVAAFTTSFQSAFPGGRRLWNVTRRGTCSRSRRVSARRSGRSPNGAWTRAGPAPATGRPPRRHASAPAGPDSARQRTRTRTSRLPRPRREPPACGEPARRSRRLPQ